MPSNLTSADGLWTSASGRNSKPRKSRGNVVKERLSNLSDTDDSGSVSISGSGSLSSDKGAGAMGITIPAHGASSSPSPTIQSQSSLDSGHGSLPEAAAHMGGPNSPTVPSATKKAGLFSRLKKVSLTTGPNAALDVFHFEGEGVLFKGKLVGIADVEGARGDDMCQRAMLELTKALKVSKEHKSRITISVAMSGLKIKDEKETTVLHHHTVPKVSYIWRDQSDLRSFGYICGTPDVGHKFYALKADRSADAVVGAIHRLFQLAFKMKQHEIEQHRKAQASTGTGDGEEKTAKKDELTNGSNGVIQTEEVNLLDLESELQVLSQGIQHMQTMQSQAAATSGDGQWVADFGNSDAWPSQPPAPTPGPRGPVAGGEGDMSSSSSTTSSQSDPWGRGGTPQSQRTITPDPFDTVGAMAASLAADPFAAPMPSLFDRSVPSPATAFAPVSHTVGGVAPVPVGGAVPNPFADAHPASSFAADAQELASLPLFPVEPFTSVFDQPASSIPPTAAEIKPVLDPFATSNVFDDLCPPLNQLRSRQRKISKEDFPQPIKPTLGDLRGEKPALTRSTSTVDPFLISATRMAVHSAFPDGPAAAVPSGGVEVPQRRVGVVNAPSVPPRPLPHPPSAPVLSEAAHVSPFALGPPQVPRRLSPSSASVGIDLSSAGMQQVPSNPFLTKPLDDPFADSFFR